MNIIYFFNTAIESEETAPPTTRSRLLSLQSDATSITLSVTSSLCIPSLPTPRLSEKSTFQKQDRLCYF